MVNFSLPTSYLQEMFIESGRILEELVLQANELDPQVYEDRFRIWSDIQTQLFIYFGEMEVN